MGAALYHEFVMNSPIEAKQLVDLLKQNAGAAVERGKPLRVIVTVEDRRRTPEANAFYWGVVLRQISEQVWVNGKQFDADTWHEFYAQAYCPHTDVVLPSGAIFSRRKSTSDMGQKEFAEYITRVQANAANDHGVSFDETF